MSLIQTRTPENILEQMDSFHNHQAKGWAKWMLRHTGGTHATWGHHNLVVCLKNLLLQEKLQWHSLSRRSLSHLAPGLSKHTAQGCRPKYTLAGAQPSSSSMTADGGKVRAQSGWPLSPPCCPRHYLYPWNHSFLSHLQLGMSGCKFMGWREKVSISKS